MRVAILGAGAMGSWFGGQLALQGHAIQLLTTNTEHIKAVLDNGLVMQVHSADESCDTACAVRVNASVPEEYDGNAELIIVLTKSHQTSAAMQTIAPNLAETTAVLSLQNGLGNAEVIQTFVPEQNIWMGISMMPVDRIGPGIVASRGIGKTSFGRIDGAHHAFGDRIAHAFENTGMDVQHDTEVWSRIWEKVAFNAGMNALCALTHGTPGTIGSLPEARSLARHVALEVAAVASADGVKLNLESVYATIDYACEHHGSHLASMLQDLLAGKRTEVDALNGAIVRIGQRHGLETPLNATLATLVRLAELGEHG